MKVFTSILKLTFLLLYKPVKTVALFLLLGLGTFTAYGQQATPVPIAVTLHQYLHFLESTYEVSFSYNSSLLSALLYQTLPCSDLESCLQNLSAQFPIEFEANGQGSYLIVPQRKDMRFTLWDTDKNSKIPYAMVQVNQGPAQYLLPVKGVYTVPNLFLGDLIHIQTGFYESLKVKADDYLGTNEVPIIVLEPSTQSLAEVSIQEYLTAGIDLQVENHSLNVDMDRLALLAGETDGDVLNLIKNIPGIQSPDGKPGNLNIRNSAFDHSALFFDGIPIYHTGHFFGTISPYNTMAVASATIQRGALEARYGNKVGGLIDIKTREDVPDSIDAQLGINSVYSGGSLAIPVLTNKVGLHLSARSNYPIQVLSPKMSAFNLLNFQGSRLDPQNNGATNKLIIDELLFNDLNGKLVWEPNERHHFHINGISIGNSYSYVLESPNINLKETENITMSNRGWTAFWWAQLLPKLETELSMVRSSLFLSENKQTQENGQQEEDEILKNELKDFRIQALVNYELSKAHLLSAGYERSQLETNFEEFRIQFDDYILTNNDQGTLHSSFIQYQWLGYAPLSVQIGLHSDVFERTEDFFVDPRVHITYKAHRHVWFKASGGRAHQFLMRYFNTDFNDFRTSNQFWLMAERNVPVLESQQWMLGGLFQKGGWTFDIEGYSKTTSGLTFPGNQVNREPGQLSTTGMDLFLKKRWAGIETWISYSLSKTDIDFKTKEAAHFDQRHNFTAVVMLKGERWGASASWFLLSGMPVRIPEIEPNSEWIETPYTDRFPYMHQLDLSANYKFWKKANTYRGVIGASVLNAYNQQNIVNIFQSNARVNNPYRYSVGIAPNIHLSLRF